MQVRVTQIKKGDRFFNEYWGREVIAATNAYRLDGTVDPVNYHATKPKPKVGVCHWNGTEWVRDWWMIEVGVNDGKGSAGAWSEVEHRSIEVKRDDCPNCGRPYDDQDHPGDPCDVCGAQTDGRAEHPPKLA